jgi:hypothetical protein
MKNLLIIFVLFFFSITVFGQKLIDSKKVPTNIQKVFKRKNSRATDIKWFDNREKREYTVKFKDNGADSKVIIDYNAVILEKRTNVEYKKLPSRITNHLKSEYKKLKFHSAELVLKGRKDKYYSIIMYESQGRKKEPKIWEIEYTIQGNFLTVYEPPVETEEEEISNDRYDEKMEEEAAELQGRVRDEAVDKKDLPTAITNYLKKNYDAEYRTKEILLKSNSKYGQYYYIVMKKQGEKKEFVHYFDVNGKLLKKKEVDL